MNNPPYIITDEMGTVVEDTRLALVARDGVGTWPVLNYQYGYINELNETLQQFAKTRDYAILKFPLFYLAQPFTVKRGEWGYYGGLNGMRAFIIMETGKNYKAHDRMTKIFKPVIYPIYDEWLVQMVKSSAFFVPQVTLFEHSFTDRYYWGEKQMTILKDVVDCREISGFNLKVRNNKNCNPAAKQMITQQT